MSIVNVLCILHELHWRAHFLLSWVLQSDACFGRAQNSGDAKSTDVPENRANDLTGPGCLDIRTGVGED